MSKTVYTLTVGATSVTFVRQVSGEFERFFSPQAAYATSKILRGTTRRTVIDVAGVDYPALTLRAEFTTAADAATCRDLTGQQGTLTNTRGQSATVLLAKAIRTETPSYAYTLDLTFERLS